MNWLLVADVHGQFDLFERLLVKAGAVADGDRASRDELKVCQIGDLANCVAADREDDLRCLRAAADGWADVVLVGNHEHPYFGGPAFAGFAYFAEVHEELRRLDRLGILQPALRVGNVLVSHAGLTPDWGFTTAEGAVVLIEQQWRLDPTAPLFSRIGRARGGRGEHGGILWSDWSEPKAAFPQIVGHTPRPGSLPSRQPADGGWSALNIDCSLDGRRLTGVLLGERGTFGGELPVISSRKSRGDRVERDASG